MANWLRWTLRIVIGILFSPVLIFAAGVCVVFCAIPLLLITLASLLTFLVDGEWKWSHYLDELF